MAFVQQDSNLQGGGDSLAEAEAVTEDLRLAFENGVLEEIRRLLPKYFDPSFPTKQTDERFNPPTFWATEFGCLEGLVELVDKYNCELNYVDEKFGQDLLYIACSRGKNEVVQYLALKHRFDPNKPNKAGITPLFAACHKGYLDTVRVLIEEFKCDPLAKSPYGDTLLHTACINGHFDIARYLVSKHQLNPEDRNRREETPLHYACSGGHLEVVQYLVDKLCCNLAVVDITGYTPLHYACLNGHGGVVSYILENDDDATHTLFDQTGSTPLHLASRNGRKEVVKALLSSIKVDPNALSLLEEAPIEIAIDNDTIKELIRGGAKPVGRRYQKALQHYKKQEPLNSLVHIFVIGYELSGKTTLIKALQQRINVKSKFFNFAGITSRQVEVIERTAGIVPLEFDSPDFGEVLFFDFAGQHEYHASHAAVLEHFVASSAPVFLLVINMTDDIEEIKRKTNYWVSFILNNPVYGNSRPHMIIVGSHVDQLQKKSPTFIENVQTLEKFVRNKLSETSIFFSEFFALDCRDPFKQDALRRCLRTSCQALRTDEEIDACCHVLRVFLLDKFSEELYCTIEDVVSEAKESDYPLPIQADRLCELAEAMSTHTKVLFLRNQHKMQKSWIVLDTDAVLQMINGRLFAPQSFAEHVFTPSATGVLSMSQLEKQFPNFDPDLMLAFLGQQEICQIVSDPEELDLLTQTGTDSQSLKVDVDVQHPSWDNVSQVPLLEKDCANPAFFTSETHPHVDIGTNGQSVISVHSSFNHLQHSAIHNCPPKNTYQRSQSCPPAGLNQENSSHSSVYYSTPNLLPMVCGSLHQDYKVPSQSASQEFLGSMSEFENIYLFFPGLIRLEQPSSDIWIPDDSYSFYTGWCLECTNDEQWFGVRFLTTLILRLASEFAIKKASHNYKQVCTFWKNGLCWLSFDGIETIVEVVEDGKGVILLMRASGQESLMKGLRLRSAVIRKILDTKEQYCARVAVSEYLIDESHLRTDHKYPVITGPLRTLIRYDMTLIAEALILKKDEFMWDTATKATVHLKDVVNFDPYLGLGEEKISKLHEKEEQDKSLSQELLKDLAECMTLCQCDKAELFCKILLNDKEIDWLDAPMTSCLDMLIRYWETGATLAEFRKDLDKYSLFAGRNILTTLLEATVAELEMVEKQMFDIMQEVPKAQVVESSESYTDEETDDGAKALDLFEKHMQGGYVLCHIHTLMLIGVAGAGKTSFLQLILNLPPPQERESTPLARNAIRAVSISHAIVSEEGSMTFWRTISPEDLLSWIAEGIKGEAIFQFMQPLPLSPPLPMPPPTIVQHSLAHRKEPESPFVPVTANPKSPPTESFDVAVVDPKPFDCSVVAVKKPLYERLSKKKCVQKLMQKIKNSTGTVKVFDDHWVYLVDTGGQPQFHELLPTFIQNVTGAAIFVKLNESFDSRPQIAYYSQGGDLCGRPYSSSLTHMETIQNCLQVLQSRRNLSGEIECPRIFCVGTHRDLVSCEEDIESKNERLLETIRTHENLKENLSYYRSIIPEELMYTVDAKNPQLRDHKVAEEFRQAVMSQCSVIKRKIPLRWFILERLLLQLSLDKKSSVLSLEECQKEADDLEMDAENLRAALDYLVRLNLFKFFPRDLPNVVFTTAQVFLDKVSELVEYSHYLRGEVGTTNAVHVGGDSESVKFRDYGIVTADFLQKRFPKHYIDGLFTSCELLKVLSNQLVFAHKGDHQFYMPCVLPELPSENLSAYRIDTKSSPVSPLLVFCPGGLFPSGNFNGLVAFLQNKTSWKVAEERGLPKCLYKNCLKFTNRDRPEVLTLMYSFEYIEVHAKVPIDLCATSCLQIANTILDGVTEAAKAQKCEHLKHQLAFFCTCEENKDLPHYASVDCTRHCRCSKNDEKHTRLTKKQLFWIKSSCSSVPRLSGLRDTYKILLPVASKWQDIAVLLNISDDKIRVIQQENPYSVSSCLRAMLSEWLAQVDPTDTVMAPSWSSLAQAIEQLGNQAKAKEIRDKYIP